MLVAIHIGVSMVARDQMWQLEQPDESQKYAKAVHGVMKHYDIPIPSGSVLALTDLGSVMWEVYGRRVAYMREQQRAQRQHAAPAPMPAGMDIGVPQPVPQPPNGHDIGGAEVHNIGGGDFDGGAPTIN